MIILLGEFFLLQNFNFSWTLVIQKHNLSQISRPASICYLRLFVHGSDISKRIWHIQSCKIVAWKLIFFYFQGSMYIQHTAAHQKMAENAGIKHIKVSWYISLRCWENLTLARENLILFMEKSGNNEVDPLYEPWLCHFRLNMVVIHIWRSAAVMLY